ncbi:MAG TPA: TonB C-terminal domain-containing protein [Candidatus Dormibacteraeota bacterium]|nr:TonB C-terminal domain-containing protein [Candidatus Dormibacteraeota bacterium]
MIPRTLVPPSARIADDQASSKTSRRTASPLDERTLVPADLPVVALDGRSTIPAYLPLDSISKRVVVPRDMPGTALDVSSNIPAHVPLTILDSRVAVPRGVSASGIEPKGPVSANALPEVVDADLFTTGEVNLLVKPPQVDTPKWQAISRISSIVFHSAFVLFILIQPKLFPYRPPTQAEMEMARRQLPFVTYIPLGPGPKEVPKVANPPNELSSPKMRIDPRILRKVAPPTVEPQPLPGKPEPERVVRELPEAPKAQITPPSSAATPPLAAQPKADASQPSSRLERPDAPKKSGSLVLPDLSPGKALHESLQQAMKGHSSPSIGGSSPLPQNPSEGGGGTPSGGGGPGTAGAAIEMLTPDEGVDFNNYLARVYASVKRNWFAVMPESVRLGDRGRVTLQFKIMRNGTVPSTEPFLVATSGKEPLDRAALSSIHASNPFEVLPSAFSGPYIELRFTYLYNLPLSAAQ